MSDKTSFTRAVLDRLVALEGGTVTHTDVTDFTTSVRQRLAALEGGVPTHTDVTSFTTSVLARLSALEGGGGGGVIPPAITGMTLGSNMIEHYDYYFSSPFPERMIGAPDNYGLYYVPSAFSTTTTSTPSANLSADKWPISNPATGVYFQRVFTLEGGKSYTMTWSGDFLSASDMFFMSNVTRNSFDAVNRTANFTTTGPAGEGTLYIFHYAINTSTPAINIRLTEDGAASTGPFYTGFVTEVNRYRSIRFMKWCRSVELNLGISTKWGGGTFGSPTYPLTWAKRNTTTGGSWWGSDDAVTIGDGIPVEHMVALANDTSADPWFCMPWNASDDYITGFATYVRDNLGTSRLAYVECSNEVWNGAYLVELQAAAEAADQPARYPVQGGDGSTPRVLRYIDQAARVMKLWTDVFAAAPGGSQVSRLRRIIAAQHVQSGSAGVSQMTPCLSYANAQGWLTYLSAPLFDCYATAPYFSAGPTYDATYTGLPAPFFAACRSAIDATLIPALVGHKALATTYGLTMIGYEGCFGHDINDLTTLTTLKTDAGMYDTYLYHFQELHRNGMAMLQTFNFCQPIGTPDGIYGSIFPTRKTMPAITKTTLPALAAIVDYQAAVRLLYDCTLKNGSLGFHLNDPDGTVGGQLDKFVEDADYSLSDPSGYFTIDNTTKQIKVKAGTGGVLPAGSYSIGIIATPKTGVTGANGVSSITTNVTATVASFALFAARYVKIVATASDGDTNNVISISEFEVATSVGGANVSGTATASSPNTFGTQPPALAIDGDINTYFEGNTMPVTLKLDFGATSSNWPKPAEIRIAAKNVAGQANQSPSAFTIQISPDDSTYTTIITKTSETGWTQGQKRTYPV